MTFCSFSQVWCNTAVNRSAQSEPSELVLDSDVHSKAHLLHAVRRPRYRPLRLALRCTTTCISHAALQLCGIHRFYGFHLLLNKSWWQRCHLPLHVGHLLRSHPAHLVHGLHIFDDMSDIHWETCANSAHWCQCLTIFIISGFIFIKGS